jgi:hypothetical protein
MTREFCLGDERTWEGKGRLSCGGCSAGVGGQEGHGRRGWGGGRVVVALSLGGVKVSKMEETGRKEKKRKCNEKEKNRKYI